MSKQSELRALLARVRSGLLGYDELYHAIHTFGEEGFDEARVDVEGFLSHPRPELRNIALSVLVLHWGSQDHRGTAERFALSDPDGDNRRMGVACLGSLSRGTRDPQVLRVLLKIFRDEKEEWHVRDESYCAILDVLGAPKSEQPPLGRELDYDKDVNLRRMAEAEAIVAARSEES